IRYQPQSGRSTMYLGTGIAAARSLLARQTKFFTAPAHQRANRKRNSRTSVVETLERRMLMHSSPVLDAEHLAVFGARDATTGAISGGLVPDSSLTYISVARATPEK